MIHLTARLQPDAETAQALTDTFHEIARCCQWVNDQAPADAMDMHALRAKFYRQLRHESNLNSAHCDLVFSLVAQYRKAVKEAGIVSGPIQPQKITYYKNGLSLEGRRASVLTLGNRERIGRALIPFDLPQSSDYDVLKTADLKRADLIPTPDGWLLELTLIPNEIIYTEDQISYPESA